MPNNSKESGAMFKFAYAFCILLAIGGVMLMDWHGKLGFWHDKRRTALAVFTGVALFVIWDLLGIHFGIFFKGNSPYMLGLEVWPEFPVEELLFLFLLCYMPLLIYRGVERGYRHLPRFKR